MDQREALENEYLVARMLGSSPAAWRGAGATTVRKNTPSFCLGVIGWFRNGVEDEDTEVQTFTGAGPKGQM